MNNPNPACVPSRVFSAQNGHVLDQNLDCTVRKCWVSRRPATLHAHIHHHKAHVVPTKHPFRPFDCCVPSPFLNPKSKQNNSPIYLNIVKKGHYSALFWIPVKLKPSGRTPIVIVIGVRPSGIFQLSCTFLPTP